MDSLLELLNQFGPWGAIAATLLYLFLGRRKPAEPQPVSPSAPLTLSSLVAAIRELLNGGPADPKLELRDLLRKLLGRDKQQE